MSCDRGRAGADPRIANKHREKPIEILAKDDPLREDLCVLSYRLSSMAFRLMRIVGNRSTRAEAELAMDNSDLVQDNDSDVAGEEGGESGEE